ncbi:MAG: EF-P lysine aminoacylase EpmA [Myxococcota bacterium]
MHTMPPMTATDTHAFCRKLQQRSQAMAAARSFFAKQGFWEVDTPMLSAAAVPDPHIDPVAAQLHETIGKPGNRYFLHTSPELFLKRVLAAGAQRVYQLSHVFRDGELDRLHRIEFTMLEWYRLHSSMQQIIHDCQQLFVQCKQQMQPYAVSCYDPIQWHQPIEQLTMQQLWQQHAGIDLEAALRQMQQGNQLALVQAVLQAGHALRDNASFEDAFTHMMLTCIEPHIGQQRPCAVTHWPAQMACLAQLCPENSLFAQRFEIYAGGVELANGFVELTDPTLQRQRFEQDNIKRQRMGKPILPLDEAFLRDLQHLPPCVGVAVGFDRLLMLQNGHNTLRDVTVF